MYVSGGVFYILPTLKQCIPGPVSSPPPTHLQSPAEPILLLQDSPISLKVMTELGLMLYTG